MACEELTASQLKAKSKITIQLIDVREKEEFLSQHISGSKNIPLSRLAQEINKLNKNKEIILICRSGKRSKLACEFLKEKGYNVKNLSGGILAWHELNKHSI